MRLSTLLRQMTACNPEATLDIQANCDHEVTLRWNFMGISHSVKKIKIQGRMVSLTVLDIEGRCLPFQRSFHVAKVVMRCRMNLRKLYQNNPELHAQMMKGALK